MIAAAAPARRETRSPGTAMKISGTQRPVPIRAALHEAERMAAGLAGRQIAGTAVVLTTFETDPARHPKTGAARNLR